MFFGGLPCSPLILQDFLGSDQKPLPFEVEYRSTLSRVGGTGRVGSLSVAGFDILLKRKVRGELS